MTKVNKNLSLILFLIYFILPATSSTINQDVLSEDKYTKLHIWNPNSINSNSGHISLSLCKGNNDLEYISLYKGLPVYGNDSRSEGYYPKDLSEDITRRQKQEPDHEIKIYSLDQDAMKTWVSAQKTNIKYHEIGDYLGEPLTHNEYSIIVELLSQGRVKKLLEIDETTKKENAIAFGLGGGIQLLSQVVSVSVKTGTLLGLTALTSIPYVPTAAASLSTFIDANPQIFVSFKITENKFQLFKKKITDIPKKMMISVNGSYYEKAYGHSALAPIGTGFNAARRTFVLGFNETLELINKAREREETLYPDIKSW